MLGIRSGLTRSTLAAGAAVLLTAPLMVGITPAAAAGAPKATTYTAVASWTATGPASLGFPGEVVRPAAASVAMSGPPALGLSRLGTPSFAQLSSVTS